jgi:DNA-binding transcriptional LysR family regulator
MELHEIRYFLALCETMNFTRAAEMCNITQPALTRAVRRLVNRERGNTHLTELGRLMQPYFKKMLNQKEAAERRARDFVSLKEARLTVGVMCTIGPSGLIDLFRLFTERHRGIRLSVMDGAASEIEILLIAGSIDVAIYCKPELVGAEIRSFTLYNERFVVAVSPSHSLARLPVIRFRDLDGHSYLWRTNCEYADQIDKAFDKLGLEVEYPYNSERDDWIQSMVMAGLGFTLIPEYAVTMPGLVTRPLLEPEFERHIKLATMRGRPFLPTVRTFVEHVRHYPWEEKMCAQARGTESF